MCGDKLFPLKLEIVGKCWKKLFELSDNNNDLLGKEISGSFEIYSNFETREILYI